MDRHLLPTRRGPRAEPAGVWRHCPVIRRAGKA
jgi:hypothetical protein